MYISVKWKVNEKGEKRDWFEFDDSVWTRRPYFMDRAKGSMTEDYSDSDVCLSESEEHM